MFTIFGLWRIEHDTHPSLKRACPFRKKIPVSEKRVALSLPRTPQANPIPRQREDVNVTAAEILAVPTGTITEDGLRGNIRVGVQYLEAWLGGNGCVPLYNLMEDAATAEISRARIWQWLKHNAALADGRKITTQLYDEILPQEMARIEKEVGSARFSAGNYARAAKLFSEMSKSAEFAEFLTLPAYELLD